MKCNNCNKFIPDVSTVCPYCNNPVDPNSKPNIIDFGDIDNVNLNQDKFDIKVYIKEPKNKKIVGGAIALIAFIIIIFIALIMSLFTNKNAPDYKMFTEVVSTFSTFLEDNYLLTKTSSSGKYRLTAKINNKAASFNGNYAYDVKSKLLSLNGIMHDPKEGTEEILIDTRDFEFNLYLKDNNLYFQSNEIYDNPYILFPIEDSTGFLTTKNYDIYSLVIGSSDALIQTLKVMNYETTNANITYLGQEIKTTKKSLVLDNKNKLKFISTLLNNLIEDSNFINEMARVRDKKSDEIIQTLENYITTSEYKYSASSSDVLNVSIYYHGSKIYRIELVNKEDKEIKYQLDIGETKYYLEYFIDNENIYSATLAFTKKELDNLIEKNYDITFDKEGLVSDISIFIEEDKQSNVKKQEITDYKSIKDFTDDDYFKVSSNASYYLENIKFIDDIKEYYKEKCTTDLKCVCDDSEDICNCTYNDRIIKCPKNLITVPVQSEITP